MGRRSFCSPFGELRYLVHSYNVTWRYERCIEVPIARAFIRQHPGPGLEIGNVLSHYGRVRHRVIDKYERGRGVENSDVIEATGGPFSYIVSVSTLEHVGWDEPDRADLKALHALQHLRSLLAPSGQMLVSFRLGHHPALTRAVLNGRIPVDLDVFYRQHGCLWEPISRSAAEAEFDPEHHELLWIGVIPPA